jgi:endonuclease/exonuclease/phosphatase family metal-dependent hydrolase
MKIIFKLLMYLLIFIIVVLSGLIIFGSLTAFNPEKTTILKDNPGASAIEYGSEISLISWNLGYAGLGDDMDFFYDGGKKVRTTHERTLENLDNILAFISDKIHTDIFLFQEVDLKARRSYWINLYDSLQGVLPWHDHSYGKNYHSRFVPLPIYSPMGYVNSGIVSSSRPIPLLSSRISFPTEYPWPERLFNLRRCIVLNRYAVTDGKELVVINTHNSAFDDGSLRRRQMQFLEDIMLREYEKGNYVIAGGDWNQCPPGFEPDFSNNVFDSLDLMYIPSRLAEGWQWVYDPTVPTNRRMQAPYDESSTLTTVIDFFLSSPNIQPLEVNGINLEFRHSDHNPVYARFRLGKDGH